MYQSPLTNIKVREDWMIVGHNSSLSKDSSPRANRAIYSFQPRIRHLDFRKTKRQKPSSFNQTFTIDYSNRDTELFPKFPERKTPIRNKRPSTEYIDFLGTQLLFVANKRNNRFFLV